MFNRGVAKNFLIHLRAVIYRKHLHLTALISLIILCLMLLKSNLLGSFVITNVRYNYTLNKQQIKEINPAKLLNNKSIEISLNEKMKEILKCKDVPLRQEKLQYGEYWLLKNYIRGHKSINMGCGETITYTTHGDYTFIENLPTIVERWLAPISFALYAPGGDYKASMDSIQYARNCLPQSQLIRKYVTFHIFFHRQHLPLFIAKNETEALNWKYSCLLKEAPYINKNRSKMYRSLKNLTYPINVARNIARKNTNTHFVFACDIELYPSTNLVNQFLKMIWNNSSLILKAEKPIVFVLPVFELNKGASLPNDKEELQNLSSKSLAIPFHKYVCPSCHLVPQQQEWLDAKNSEELTVFTVGKRYAEFAMWEPFYISDNNEPIFDERVTWEGQSNKRIQNFAMCLMDYEYHVLHPAFLVHEPGIKKLDPKSKEFKRRQKYVLAMNDIIDKKIVPEYRVLYGENKRCAV